jgi:RimJ/RimL family protein N-acetyltransferase
VLTAFLKLESARPLYAAASEHNPGSQRVLEKCGFVRIGQEDWLDETGDVIRGLVFERKV